MLSHFKLKLNTYICSKIKYTIFEINRESSVMKKKVVDESIARLEEHVNYVGRFSDEKVESVSQCFGYRLAYLADLNSIIFDSLFSGKFSRDDIAICNKEHSAPFVNCACGFYSFKEFFKARNERKFFKKSMILKVENFGEIVEHELGWRSANQLVTEINLPKKCSWWFCSSKAVAFVKGENVFIQSCKYHYRKAIKNNVPCELIDYFVVRNKIKVNFF